jgi:hypothetical protein
MPKGTVLTTSYNTSIQAIADTSVALISDQSSDVPVTVLPAGTVGNVPAYNIWNAVCNGHSNTGLNTQAFTGGQDAQSYTAVQQSDIDKASSQLRASTAQAATDDLRAKANPNEQLVGTPQCTPTTSSDHVAGDQASTVTVTVQTTCTGTLST